MSADKKTKGRKKNSGALGKAPKKSRKDKRKSKHNA